MRFNVVFDVDVKYLYHSQSESSRRVCCCDHGHFGKFSFPLFHIQNITFGGTTLKCDLFDFAISK